MGIDSKGWNRPSEEAEVAGSDWLWLILAVAVIAGIVAAVVIGGRQRERKHTERAESMRQDAGEQSRIVRQREGKAAEVDASARAAQAESEAKAAEAERLALTAERQKAEASKQRSAVDDQFRKADEIDPGYDSRRDGDDSDSDDGRSDRDGDRDSDRDRGRDSDRDRGSDPPR